MQMNPPKAWQNQAWLKQGCLPTGHQRAAAQQRGTISLEPSLFANPWLSINKPSRKHPKHTSRHVTAPPAVPVGSGTSGTLVREHYCSIGLTIEAAQFTKQQNPARPCLESVRLLHDGSRPRQFSVLGSPCLAPRVSQKTRRVLSLAFLPGLWMPLQFWPAGEPGKGSQSFLVPLASLM